MAHKIKPVCRAYGEGSITQRAGTCVMLPVPTDEWVLLNVGERDGVQFLTMRPTAERRARVSRMRRAYYRKSRGWRT